MRFESTWEAVRTRSGVIYRPTLAGYIERVESNHERRFLVNSGADLSMAPRSALDEERAAWEDGERQVVRGISRKEECAVEGRVHWTRLVIPQASFWIELPICFVEGDAPFVIGREVFFDLFRLTFDKEKRKTVFETKHV